MRNSQKWCAILCNYRTRNYEDFKILSRKIKKMLKKCLQTLEKYSIVINAVT